MTVWLGDYDVAKMTSRIPHPYNEADAEDFLAGLNAADRHIFAIQRKQDGLFIGCIGLNKDADRAGDFEMGYWLGKPFWGLGFATEAARRLTDFTFGLLDQDRVKAGWYHDNPASGHVLAKLGARHNGSKMRDCAARKRPVLCHEMLLTRADFLRKQAA
jgi:RimJ/RimL family protein N-acetyltransferase